MRGFLIFLAFAAPFLLFHPTFQWLVASEVGAAPSAVIEADGTRRDTFIGPKSPWPDWALIPRGGKVTPRAWYGPAPQSPAYGFGDVALESEPLSAIKTLVADLMKAGWTVEMVRYRLQEPSLPPHWFAACTITARRAEGDGERTAMYSFRLEPAERVASLHWREGPPLPSWASAKTMKDWMQPQPNC